MDGEELMLPRVPNLPSEASARQIAEDELTGHAVYRSWCRHCVASKGRAHALLRSWQRRCVADLVSNGSTGCLGATVDDSEGSASECASSFLTAFIKSLVRSDNERSLLSLIERVMNNLTGVELVLMTSPEGDHQANGLA